MTKLIFLLFFLVCSDAMDLRASSNTNIFDQSLKAVHSLCSQTVTLIKRHSTSVQTRAKVVKSFEKWISELSDTELQSLRLYSNYGHQMNFGLRVCDGDIELLRRFRTYFHNVPQSILKGEGEAVANWELQLNDLSRAFLQYASLNSIALTNRERQLIHSQISVGEELSHPANKVAYYIFPERVSLLDSAISKGKIPFAMTVYRALAENRVWDFDKIVIGEELSEVGYVSATLDKSVAMQWRISSSNTNLERLKDPFLQVEILVNEGTPAAFLGLESISGLDKISYEEMLLPRNSRFRVLEKSVVDGVKYVRVELIRFK